MEKKKTKIGKKILLTVAIIIILIVIAIVSYKVYLHIDTEIKIGRASCRERV